MNTTIKKQLITAGIIGAVGAALPAFAQKADVPKGGEITKKSAIPEPTGSAPASASTAGKPMAGALYKFSDKGRRSEYEQQQQALRDALLTAKDRDGYRKVLEDSGFVITAVAEDSPTELEYEVVKGDHTHEVHMVFDEGSKTAKSVDVSDNIWRADETKRAMNDANYRPAGALYKTEGSASFRDKNHLSKWTGEKERLESLMLPGKPIMAYQSILNEQGYEITSLNDRDPDYVEYEVVKGDQSYEVQLDRSPSSKLVTSVDVTTNLWQSEATEKALGQM